MNVTEHVTKLWLESKGFFVMGPVWVGHNEIDILAVKLNVDKVGVAKKIHVEVTVSGRPGGPDDGTGLMEYALRKFNGRVLKHQSEGNVSSAVKQILGEEYEKWLVVGKGADHWIADGPRNNVKVIPFSRVVSEFATTVKGAPKDEIGRLLDTLNCLGLLNPSVIGPDYNDLEGVQIAVLGE